MEKNAIKKYAIWARRELIMRVAGQAARYGITEDGWGNADADSVEGRVLSDSEMKQRVAFIDKVRAEGYEQAIEEVAYTWFNRFCALRYMEVNAYLPSHVRVFTNDVGEFKPQFLDEALHLDLEGLNMEHVLKLKEDANQVEELFRYLLITQCNALSSILPGMFQKIEDYTELLLPENLLREGSVIERLITEIPEEDWTDQVQIIGWLYQYYNAEKKDEVFASLKKNVKITKENIPAATQLFTPDWIVRYMVENSLGRLWVDGHPNEELKSTWEYYLDEPEQEPEVEVQLAVIRKEYAALKPEDIKCIDPCCGSGHILLYMFDVLMQIYESYGYTTQEAVCSIVENNLYGLDIDERAAQLAYFSVMMKARSYDRRFFSRNLQPHVYAIREVTKADYEYLEMFGPYSDMVKKLLDSFVDAKEYGSLTDPDISIEELAALEKHMGKMDEMSDYGSLNSQLFTYMALNSVWPFLEIAKLLIQKYDVVTTNPPYMGSGGMGKKLSDYIKINYPDSKNDLFAVFTERCGQINKNKGYQAMITQPSFMSLSSFEKLRKKVFFKRAVVSLLDMGRGIFGIDFGSTSFVLRNFAMPKFNGIYFNLKKRIFQYVNPDDICTLFLIAKNNHKFKYDFESYDIDKGIRLDSTGMNGQQIYYTAQQSNFSKIPGSPIAYWVSENVMDCYMNKSIYDYSKPCKGIDTGNNDLFLRYWFEINVDGFFKPQGIPLNGKDFNSKKWFPYNKGGEFRKWYGNNEYIINWENNGDTLKNYSKSNLRNKDTYFRRGITWSTVTSGKSSFRWFDYGYLFDNGGSCLFASQYLLYIQAMLNSCVAEALLKIQPTINNQPGTIGSLPLIVVETHSDIENVVEQNISISKDEWDSFETSWDFQQHPFIRWSRSFWDITCTCANFDYFYPGKRPDFREPLKLSWLLWQGECNERFQNLKQNEEELNRIFVDIYGLQDELTPEVKDSDVTVRKADLKRDIKSLISYAVGCMLGRYSLDVEGLAYAGGEWDATKYRTYMPDYNGILPICDDEYFTDDIVGHFVDFIRTVYGEDTLEENLQFIASALGGKGSAREVIRKYFLNDFYADHCKTYQKRPIYWLFDSGKKNGFKCLIYLHRYRPDTIARIRTDYVHEQQARYRTAISELNNRISGASASEGIKLKKTLSKLQDQADELIGYEEKIHHLADQFIDIDLDDGVKVNYAKFQDVLGKIK